MSSLSEMAVQLANSYRSVLKGVPVNRLIDLAERKAAGHLTNAETLALAVLAGGESGETAIQPLIDAALEEYSHGSYRVPVRVVADWRRCLFVLTAPPNTAEWHLTQMNRDWIAAVNKLAREGAMAITVAAGSKIEVFECKPEEAGVEVRSSPNGV